MKTAWNPWRLFLWGKMQKPIFQIYHRRIDWQNPNSKTWRFSVVTDLDLEEIKRIRPVNYLVVFPYFSPLATDFVQYSLTLITIEKSVNQR